ncbi:lipase family protein [Corallococcus silvisoli]|uniref:lipase family protein n=1 Tax=Corallococcus silvisoli TaxID=2697031 RepID=UPI0013774FD4|nr:hypothetical protein [Corallococcus silvisoli]NBD12352.1 hypothetical protein [Corallococcus silvisoli]
MPDVETALEMLEYCRFAYKAYAQTCTYPLDPFYEAHGAGKWQGARDRVMAHVHKLMDSDEDVRKFDPIEYNLTQLPNPSHGIVYRGGSAEEPYILFQPRELDRSISYVQGVALDGSDIWGFDIHGAIGSKRCCYFQGKTGMTQTHPEAGWPSWMGAAIYDPDKQRMVITFRGSRSGKGGRALSQALVKSAGSPDWVTDMNHLKAVQVPRFSRASLACGFWYAYESCRESLEGAFLEALHHRGLKEIIFTGHSLGGALAQCAYIDMMGGELLSRSAAMQRLKKTVPISCYAISAPPIVLGRESAAKVSVHVGAMNIFHYFSPKDAVHHSAKVDFSGVTAVNSVVGFSTHPLTTAVHLGTEFPLEGCTAAFPDSHEPEEVRRGLVAAIASFRRMGLGADPGFWPTFEFNPCGAWGASVRHGWATGTLAENLKMALVSSVSDGGTQARAELWSEVIKGMESGGYRRLDDTNGAAFDSFGDAVRLVGELSNPFTDNRAQNALELKKLRTALLKSYEGASSHKATSSVYFVMLQYLTAMQYGLDIV